MSLLELQVTDLDQDVNFLFDEQVIQDERLLELEQTDNQVVVELVEINADLQGKIIKFCELNFYSSFFFGFNKVSNYFQILKRNWLQLKKISKVSKNNRFLQSRVFSLSFFPTFPYFRLTGHRCEP